MAPPRATGPEPKIKIFSPLTPCQSSTRFSAVRQLAPPRAAPPLLIEGHYAHRQFDPLSRERPQHPLRAPAEPLMGEGRGEGRPRRPATKSYNPLQLSHSLRPLRAS